MILLCGRRRFGRFTSTSSEGLCGRNPFRRSRFALLRIDQRGRCNSLAICDIECVGHKVTSSRNSSSVQRDITASVMKPPAHGGCHDRMLRTNGAVSAIAAFPHGTNKIGDQSVECSKVNRPADLPTLHDSVSEGIFICDFAQGLSPFVRLLRNDPGHCCLILRWHGRLPRR